ncbi:hypothetical protein GOP47_0021529 [Adiantum capillus-veneris]|uniref:Uncharacterized protein n=1 Tax=Adiantum capillus-veneris TaxID=13818 RepID=A0A9D4U8J6_ADICA|nr:hypothetical protein GOP47_0021529 [Adiantum capillus-veneris]
MVGVCDNGEEVASDFGTLSVQRMEDSECAYHIVVCKLPGTSTSFQQKFSSTGPKDPEGWAAAYCFALSTGCLPAFRAFLFEHLERVNFGSSCLTDQSCLTVFINLRKNAFLGLCFSAAVCRFQDGSLRSVSFRSSSEQAGFEQVTAFFNSPKLRNWVLRSVKMGTSIAGELENHRRDGMPMAVCKCCGELEPSDCSNQQSQQASEEYRCSACLVMERKLIFAIRLEAQGEVAECWETLWSEAGSFTTHDNDDVCCVCGCEDNEDLDDLVPCICQSSEAVVHTSCSVACKPVAFYRVSMPNSTPGCLICGRGVVSPDRGSANHEIAARSLKRSIMLSQVAGGDMKRPRTNSTDGVKQSENMPNVDRSLLNHVRINNSAVQTEAKEPDYTKVGYVRHLWRSADTPAIVPFKKRRIQISEVQRSPSPPIKPLPSKDAPHSPKGPLLGSFPKPVSMLTKSPSPKLEDSHSNNAGSLFSSSPLTSPKSSTVVHCIFDTISTVPNFPPTEAASPLPMSCSPETVPSKSRSLSPNRICSSLTSLSPKYASLPRSLSSFNSLPVHLPRLPSLRMLDESANPMKSPELESSQVFTPHCDRITPKVIQETENVHMHSISTSANPNQPSTSQEVEDGELVISTEKISNEYDISDEIPEVSSQIAQGQDSLGSSFNSLKVQGDRAGWDLNTNMESWDQLSDKPSHVRSKMGNASRTVGVVGGQNYTNSFGMRAIEPLKLCRNEVAKETIGIDNDHQGRISPCKEADAGSEPPITGKILGVCEGDGFVKPGTDESRRGTSDLKIGKENCERQELCRYSSVERVERHARAEDGTELVEEHEGEEQINHGTFYCREGYYKGMDLDDKSLVFEDEAYWKDEDESGKPLFWEGDARLDGDEREKKGMHSKECSTSRRVKLSGWDQLPEGFESAEEALKAAQEVMARRGRGSWVSFGGRGSSFSAHRVSSVCDDIKQSSKRFGDRHLYESFRSRDGFNHTRGLDDSGDDCYPPRGRFSGRRAVAGPHPRGCHKRWAENRQGDSIDEWRHGQHRSASGFSSQGPTNAATLAAARVESSGFVVGPDGTLSRGRTSSRGMRSTFVHNRGPQTTGRATSADMDGVSNFSKRGSPGVERCMGRSSKIGVESGDRRVRQGVGTGLAGRSMSDRRALPGRGLGDRYGRSSYVSRTMEHKRSESPCRMHLPDHSYANDCGSPGSRPEPRFKRSRLSPPSPEPFSRSKFYPPSARNQHSPPSFHKWSHDRREGENFRERDFRTPVPRYGAPGRASPHVVHGSSLMDYRDLQVLAVTRSSSGVRGGSSSLRDESPEFRRERRAEEDGLTSSFSEGGDDGDMKGGVYKRDKCRDNDKKREPYRPLSRSSGGHGHSSSLDGLDDVAPRRQRL